jgi:hypothetical protein
LNENRNTPEDKLFKQSNIPVAALLEGHFASLYKDRIGKAEKGQFGILWNAFP